MSINDEQKEMYEAHLKQLRSTVDPNIDFIGGDGSPRSDRDVVNIENSNDE